MFNHSFAWVIAMAILTNGQRNGIQLRLSLCVLTQIYGVNVNQIHIYKYKTKFSISSDGEECCMLQREILSVAVNISISSEFYLLVTSSLLHMLGQ